MSALRTCRASVVVAALAASTVACSGATHAAAPVHRSAPQGVAVVASCGEAASSADAVARSASQAASEPTCRDRALALARAVYASSLRPRSLDEVRARVLAGEPPPPSATRELRELDELRGAVAGEDAVSRRLLSSMAEQVGVEALLVVSERGASTATPARGAADAGASEAASAAADAGAPASASAAAVTEEAGAPPSIVASPGHVIARLFLADTRELDAARYEPDGSASGPGAWRGTVASLSGRFRPPQAAEPKATPVKLAPREETANKPFYASPWLWGAIGAAVLVGGLVWFTSQDTQGEPIHLQMRVPR